MKCLRTFHDINQRPLLRSGFFVGGLIGAPAPPVV